MLPSERVKKILLIKLRALGDTVLSLPSLAELRAAFPQAKISMLVPAASVELLAFDSRVDEVLAYPRQELRSLEDHLNFFKCLQKRCFDLAVCLHASYRSALLVWMSGARWRSVRNHSGFDWFSNIRSVEKKEAKSIIQRDFDALRALGLTPKNEKPVLMLSKRAEGQAEQFWRLSRLRQRKVIALLPGAGKKEKCWPVKNFDRLALEFNKKGFLPLWINAPGESYTPSAELKKKAVFASFESLQQLGAILARAGRVFGNDSGPRHIAAACGAKTFTLFGPEELREWHPYKTDEGHWAIKASSGRIEELGFELVKEKAFAWLAKT